MRFENQLVNLELAKKLKKMGYSQKGLWWWIESFNKKLSFLCIKIGDNYYKHTGQSFDRAFLIRNAWSLFVAPTVAELGKMLPEDCFSFSQLGDWHCFESIRYFERGEEVYETDADTEADARAKMWLYLKKN